MSQPRVKAHRDSIKHLMAWATANGWTWRQSKRMHLIFTHPQCKGFVTASCTPSDPKGWYIPRMRMRHAMMEAGFTKEQIKQ